MNIDTDKYFKILKDNKILEAFEEEKNKGFSGTDYRDLFKENVLIGIILYLYIISGTNGELAREVSTKIKYIKLLRDCTRWEGYISIGLRAAKIIIETLIDLDFIAGGRNPEKNETSDIKDIGICLRDELTECVDGNMDTLIAKLMLLRVNESIFLYKGGK